MMYKTYIKKTTNDNAISTKMLKLSDDLIDLRKYMLQDSIQFKLKKEKQKEKKPTTKTGFYCSTPPSLYTLPAIPPSLTPKEIYHEKKQEDFLFWCYYIMKYGTFKYQQITTPFLIEQNEKRDQIMLLREKHKELKESTGIKFTRATIENEIMCEKISLQAFQVLMSLNKLNAVYVNSENNVYLDMMNEAVSDKKIHLIEHKTKTTRYMIEITNEEYTAVCDKYYKIENAAKPIKSVSSYTVSKLIDICKMLNIKMDEHAKKQDLYDLIAKKMTLL